MINIRPTLLLASAFLTACSTPYPTATQQAAPLPAPPAPLIVDIPAPVAPPSLPNPSSRPTIQAESAIVVDAITGRVLFQKNADTQRAVASTQKLLTALVTMRSGPLTDPVTVEASDTQVEPTKIYIKPGETYQRGYLLKALLVKSGNDVAMALGRDIAGSKQNFAALMNRTAASIGMRNSNFLNPHGLTEAGQYSTARDLAVLARQVMKHPYLRQCMKSKSMQFTHPDGRTKTLDNTNKILSRLSYCTGMKTGTTRASGRCLVSSGTLNGRSVIAVALGSTSTEIWNDSEKLLKWSLQDTTAQ